MSDTPRTDALKAVQAIHNEYARGDYEEEWFLFARTLERELAAALATVKELKTTLDEIRDRDNCDRDEN